MDYYIFANEVKVAILSSIDTVTVIKNSCLAIESRWQNWQKFPATLRALTSYLKHNILYRYFIVQYHLRGLLTRRTLSLNAWGVHTLTTWVFPHQNDVIGTFPLSWRWRRYWCRLPCLASTPKSPSLWKKWRALYLYPATQYNDLHVHM